MLVGKRSIGTIILAADQELTLTTSSDQYGNTDMAELKAQILDWCRELGFQHCGISDIDLETAETRLAEWLRQRFHGSMHYMERHGKRRSRPAELVPGTVRIISVRMDYLPEPQTSATQLLDHESRAYVSRYALGRDYHKVLRGRLRDLARRIEAQIGPFGHRVFVDSAPVLEKAIAEKAGVGWIGKHTNLIDRNAGSWFFLGELYTDLPLPADEPEFERDLDKLRSLEHDSIHEIRGRGLWIGLQALVNIGVNLGVLPTKGLTLPLISSGGSSMLMVLVAIGIVLLLVVISSQLMVRYSDAPLPHLDSFTTWGAVVTTFMVARKVLENWIYWFVIDVVSIFMFLSRDLYFTTALFVGYLVMIVIGYRSWRASMNQDPA